MKLSNKFALIPSALTCFYAASVGAWDGRNEGTISTLRYKNSTLIIQQPSMSNPGACGSGAWYTIAYAASTFDQFNAALLTAYSTGKSVDLALTGCSNGYPVIAEVWLK